MGKKSKGRRQSKRREEPFGVLERLIQDLDSFRREAEEAEKCYPLVTNFALLDCDTGETIHLANLQDYDGEDSRKYSHTVNIKVSASFFISGVLLESPLKTTLAFSHEGLVFMGSDVETRVMLVGKLEGNHENIEHEVRQAGGSLAINRMSDISGIEEKTKFVIQEIRLSKFMVSSAVDCDKKHLWKNLEEDDRTNLECFVEMADSEYCPFEVRRVANDILPYYHRLQTLHDVVNLAFLCSIHIPGGASVSLDLRRPLMFLDAYSGLLAVKVKEESIILFGQIPSLLVTVSNIPISTNRPQLSEGKDSRVIFADFNDGALRVHCKRCGTDDDESTLIPEDGESMLGSYVVPFRIDYLQIDLQKVPSIQRRLGLAFA